MKPTTRVRLGAATVAAAGVLLIATLTAAAHVTVRPDVDTEGAWAKLTFRVPNESATGADTVELRVELPTETPFRSVRVQPHPGWTAEVTRENLPEAVEVDGFVLDEAVTSITWLAEPGFGIGPDEFDEIAISVGPLPAAGQYPLPAAQIYDDGEAIAWDGDPDSEHPAALLMVTEATNGLGDHGHRDDGQALEEAAGNGDGVARGLALGGLAIGAIGAGVGGAAWRRTRA